jgi:hypothetical protein
MLQLPRRPAPLAVYEPVKSYPPSVQAAGSQLALPTGQITGKLRPLSLDTKRRVAVYELLIANETLGPVASFAYAVEPPRAGGTISWNTITVPPRTTVAIPVEIPFPRRGRPQRVIAELHTDGANLTLDADPPTSPPSGAVRKVAFAIAGALLLGAAAAGYAFERPQVAALGAPARVNAGQRFQVAYALGPNVEHAEYAVETPEGRRIRHGALDPRGGSFTLDLPGASAARGYDVRVTAGNKLGESQRSAHVLALAAQDATTKFTGKTSVALAQETVDGGTPIVVRYTPDITTGSVKLLDQDGTERASALLNKRGSSILIAPKVDVAQDFRVVVDARHGLAISETLLPVRIARGTEPATQPHAVAALAAGNKAVDPPTTVPVPTSGSPIALERTHYNSGDAIVVSIAHYAPKLQIALMSDTGEELQRVDVKPEEKQLALAAPAVSGTARFLVVASFERGVGQESIISSIFVRSK